MTNSSQKFIARNRAPRVQIEYDVELYGSEKKVQLPFVMGVMSDLAGKSNVAQPSIENRKFLEIDVDNFDDRMKAMQPRAAFSVPNTLAGEGNLNVDLTFEKMADFSPQAIAEKVEPLRALLDARTQLSNLMTYMDGKAGAESLIEKILSDQGLLTAVSGATSDANSSEAALDSLRTLSVPEPDQPDNASSVLNSLKSKAPEDDAQELDTTSEVLSALAQVPEPEAETSDASSEILQGLRDSAPVGQAKDDTTQTALDNLRQEVPEMAVPDSTVADTLADLAASAPEESPAEDQIGAALESLAATDIPDAPEDTSDALLADLAASAPEEAPVEDQTGAALETLAATDILDAPEDTNDALLADLAASAPEEAPVEDQTGAALDSLAASDIPDAPEDTSDALLADLAASAPEEAPAEDQTGAALDSLAATDIPDAPEDTSDALLADLAASAPEEAPAEDQTGAALETLTAEEDTIALLQEAVGTDSEGPALGDLDDLLADTGLPAAAADGLPRVDIVDDLADDTTDKAEPNSAGADDDLDDLLADIGSNGGTSEDPEPLPEMTEEEQPKDFEEFDQADTANDLDDLLADSSEATEPVSDDLDDLLADIGLDDGTSEDSTPLPEMSEKEKPKDIAEFEQADSVDDLDDLLADSSEAPESDSDDLDDLLADIGSDDGPSNDSALLPEMAEEEQPKDIADVDQADGVDDLDDLLADLDLDASPEPEPEPEPEQGTLEDDDLDDLLDGLDNVAETDPPADTSAQVKPSAEPEFTFGVMTGDRPSAEQLSRKRFRLAILGDFSGRAARGKVEVGDALAQRRAILLDPDTVEEVIEGFATTLVLPIGEDAAGVEVKLGGLDDLHPDELYENVAIFSEMAGLRAQLSSGSTAENAASKLRGWSEAHGTPVTPTRKRSSGNAVPADRRLSDFQKLIGDTTASLAEPSPIDDLMARVVGPHIRAVPDADTLAMQDAVDQALSAAMRLILHHPEFQSVEAQWRSIDLIARSIEVDNTLEVMLYDISAEEIAADLASVGDLANSGFARLLTEDPMDEENGRGGYSALIGLYTFEETPPHAEILGRIARVAAHVDAPFLTAISPAFMDTAKEDRHPLVATAWDTLRAMPEAGHLGLASPRFMLRRPYGAKSEPIYEFEFEEFTMSAGLGGMLWANPAVLVAILLAKSFRENGPSMGLGSILSLGDIPYHFVTDRHGDQVALPCTERNLTLDKVEKVMARGVMPVVSIKGRDEIRLASFQSLAGGDILGPWSGVAPPPPSPPKPEPVAAPTPADDVEDDDDLGLDDLLAGFDDVAAPDDAPGGDDIDADLAALLEDL